jgi:nucleoid-associated protein EbfC
VIPTADGTPEGVGSTANAEFGLPAIPDVAALMDRVRQQQEEIQRIQRGVEAMEVIGASRHDEVRITVRGNGQVTNVSIDPDALTENDADQLGGIVMEAINDGLRKVAEASSARFRPVVEAASRVEQF